MAAESLTLDDKVIERFARAGANARVSPFQRPAFETQRAPGEPWPTDLDPIAFHGLAGEIVRCIEPHSEADPASLLIQVLVAFGSLVGRGPHVKVEGDQHHGNLYALLVGETSKARKGTSWGRVRSLFSVAPEWPKDLDGLSSGEGLKWAVRDSREERDRKTGAMERVDDGVSDKRLLVVESEFAQVLRQVARAGNTLSATVRSAWDTGRLATLTKSDPVTATGAHVSIIGHITADELRAELTQTDMANGFANRFIYMAVRRSKSLPFGGGDLNPEVVNRLLACITRAAEDARRLTAVGMTEEAKEAWKAAYGPLSEGCPGLFGAVTARAEAQCLRLALVYALLDGAQEIDKPHLCAAIALWERAEASARYIFGSAVGDKVADEILRRLRIQPEGLSRSDISALFSRNEKAERIDLSLQLLQRRGLAKGEKRATGGRSVEIWKCC